jgi:GTP-binding protein
MIVVATKMDAAQDTERVEALRRMAEEKGLPFQEISSATGQGIGELTRAMGRAILDGKQEA